MKPEIKAYQIFYRPEQRAQLDKLFIPYDNSNGRSPFFENEVIKNLVLSYQNMQCDYFGVLSWNIANKIKAPGGEKIGFNWFEKKIQEFPGYDVYSVFGQDWRAEMFSNSVHGHGPELAKIVNLVFHKMGMKIQLPGWRAKHVIYMNYFLARPSVYDKYVHDFLSPAMSIMSNVNEREIQDLLWRDSKYVSTTISEPERKRLNEMYGKPYYPFHTFVCERLFSVWLKINDNITVKQLL